MIGGRVAGTVERRLQVCVVNYLEAVVGDIVGENTVLATGGLAQLVLSLTVTRGNDALEFRRRDELEFAGFDVTGPDASAAGIRAELAPAHQPDGLFELIVHGHSPMWSP